MWFCFGFFPRNHTRLVRDSKEIVLQSFRPASLDRTQPMVLIFGCLEEFL